MSLKRFFGVFFGIVGAVLLVVVLYIAFGDLGRHKARIEALVSSTIGRPFAIDGPLKIRLMPVIDVSARRQAGQCPGRIAAANGRGRQSRREGRLLVADLRTARCALV